MDNILQFNRYMKSDKMPNIINADLGKNKQMDVQTKIKTR